MQYALLLTHYDLTLNCYYKDLNSFIYFAKICQFGIQKFEMFQFQTHLNLCDIQVLKAYKNASLISFAIKSFLNFCVDNLYNGQGFLEFTARSTIIIPVELKIIIVYYNFKLYSFITITHMSWEQSKEFGTLRVLLRTFPQI